MIGRIWNLGTTPNKVFTLLKIQLFSTVVLKLTVTNVTDFSSTFNIKDP